MYAVRWESKNGKSGYSPACANEWNKAVCKKPKIKCSECAHRIFLPMTDQVSFDHLKGRHTIGIYPLLPDETCWFLAVDFDKTTWKEDSSCFLETCKQMKIPAALERSRSGNGAHVWIFFDNPVLASLARQLGCLILTRTMDKRYQIGLDSYDRLFPNQDTMPKGGFGNLIALPLHGNSGQYGNTLFLDDNHSPYQDQWLFLSTLNKMKADEVERIVQEESFKGSILGVNQTLVNDQEDFEVSLFQGPGFDKKIGDRIEGPFPSKVKIVQSNLIYIDKTGLPPSMINRILRIAAFPNPEFYKAQAMRLSTFGKPRVINCAEEHDRNLALPRGCLDQVLELLKDHNIQADFSDKRNPGNPIKVHFKGELTPLQDLAAKALLKHDNGILSATTAFGKTVVASYLIAARKVNTLVLVHRKQLMEQWRERLAAFLDIPLKEIGLIGGGKDKRGGLIDVAMLQSVNFRGVVKDFVAEYGQVIVDECHHLSAFSFEQVLRQVKAKYVTGLTATPIRQDGHHPIVMMQCGPIRFRVDAKSQATARPFEHVVIPRYTSFSLPEPNEKAGIHQIYEALALDENRNTLIFDDLLMALDEGRSPLLLTERTAHVEYFANRLKGFAKNVIVLRGGMGNKQRQQVVDKLQRIPDGEERVLIATGRFIGEGFDDPRLDTLFLAMPISWKGTLQQYAGRLHRLHSNKRVVRIYDYVDSHIPVLKRMYEKRMQGYRDMGYQTETKG
ncbi:TOTE conflict system archaeo-eukaryotic primase domain-containing protein [Effusibacillus lacus]|uniref:TOTE conflict system archaeo-eukaryotic primase domain-containing protein n=1 Tax=Effusibacillus lacus TaxID=1348429 RepID=UPI001A9DC275|nr:DEAD/DEAH box helicase [Effusibacillus lacus]